MEFRKTLGGALSATCHGALLGVAFALAEVATAYLAGGRFTLRFWIYLGLYSVPVLSLSAGVLLLIGAIVRPERTPEEAVQRAAWHTLLLLTLGYLSYVERQVPPWVPLGSIPHLVSLPMTVGASLLASLAIQTMTRRASLPRGAHTVVTLAIPALLTSGSWIGFVWLQGASPFAKALLFSPLVAVWMTGGVLVLVRALPFLGAPKRAALASAVIAGTFGAICVRGFTVPASGLMIATTGKHDPPSTGSDNRDNVVLVVLDTVRASSLSCYGYSRRTTPNIDAFAREATLFSNASTTATWTIPAHASLFTGLLPPQLGVEIPRPSRPDSPLDERFVTLAEVLRAAGYSTAAIVSNPTLLGVNLEQGFSRFDARRSRDSMVLPYVPLLSRLEGQLPWRLPLSLGVGWRSGQEITVEAQRWLLMDRPRNRPFFLFVNYMDAHRPCMSRGFEDRWPGRSWRLPWGGIRGGDRIRRGLRKVTREEFEHLRSLYDAALSYLDHHLGRLLDVLARQPDADRTWIIVTSDHGEALGEHDDLGHDCNLYQEVFHIPLIIRSPRGDSGVEAGVVETPAQIVDLFPTLLEGLGIPVPEGMSGVSLRRPRGTMVALGACYCATRHSQYHSAGVAAVVQGRYKYLWRKGKAPQLFDLVADPRETTDLSSVLPDETIRRAAAMPELQQPPVFPKSAVAADEEHRELDEELKALGYLP